MDCFSRDGDNKNTAMKNRQYASIFDGEFIASYKAQIIHKCIICLLFMFHGNFTPPLKCIINTIWL